MSVKVHEAYSLDSQQDRLLWWDDFLGDQIKDEWRIFIAGAGTTVVVDAQTGGIIRITTGAVNGNNNVFDWANTRSLHVDQKISMEVRAKLNQTTSENHLIGLLFDFSNYVAFKFDTNTGVNWTILCSDAGAQTNPDSGIAADTDYHIFRIECFPTGEVHFYIDGVECANSPITTNIPDDAADFLQPYLFVSTRENVAKSVDVDYVVVRQEI